MQISNNFSVAGVGLPSGAAKSNENAKPQLVDSSSGLNPVDQLDISSEVLSSEAPSADIRTDKVAAVRRQIAEGTYDSDAKFEAAFDKLLESLS
jgi:anti-sigma28 factor (negative regulator of flagellin synthesis)